MRIHAVIILLLQGREKEHISNLQILSTSAKLTTLFMTIKRMIVQVLKISVNKWY